MLDTLNEVKKNMSIFYTGDDYTFKTTVPFTFTELSISAETEEVLVLKIVTHRPGLVIGKGGKDLRDLTELLCVTMEKKVVIDLHESDMWKIKY